VIQEDFEMAHLIAFLIIGAAKLVKWMFIKTRLIIAALPAAVVLVFCKDWYEANTMLADGIGFALIAGVAASWIVTLVRRINASKHNKELIMDWAYERYGQPIVLTRKTQES
jgi:predicted histidine transporter YuiF (NhaC family)